MTLNWWVYGGAIVLLALSTWSFNKLVEKEGTKNVWVGIGLVGSFLTLILTAMVTIIFVVVELPEYRKSKDNISLMDITQNPITKKNGIFLDDYSKADKPTKDEVVKIYFNETVGEPLDEQYEIDVLGQYKGLLFFKLKNDNTIWKTNEFNSFKDTKESTVSVFSYVMYHNIDFNPMLPKSQRKYKYPELILDSYNLKTSSYKLVSHFNNDKEVEDYIKEQEDNYVYLGQIRITPKDANKVFTPTEEEFNASKEWDTYTKVKR